jgi:hypothetical protein
MAITVKHNKVSTIPDDADTSLVRPSDWNDDHVLTGTVPVANGGTGAATLTGYVVGNGTAAMTASTTIPSTAVTGLGTMSTQNSNNISVTGGSMSGVTISDYVATATKGVANGVASLDGSGTVPISQLPAAVLGALSYQGTWNASTNTPTLTSSVGTKGYYYVVNVAGSTNLNGVTDWQVGDWAVYNGTAWQKVDNTDAVTSVNGYTGTVVLNATDVGAVSSVSGTAPVSVATGTTTPVISLAASYGDTKNPYASKTANYVLASPNGSAGVPTFRALVSADIPSLTGTYIPYTGASTSIDLNAQTVTNIAHLGLNSTAVPDILLRAYGDNNSTSRIGIRGYSSNASSSSMRVAKFRGTFASPQAPLSGDSLGKFELAGYGTTSSSGYPQASYEGVATENWGATARGSKALFYTTPNTTTTQTLALTLNQDQTATFAGAVTANGVLLTGNTGTVTSVAATVPSFLSVSGSPITTSGTLALTYSGTALPILNGGTGATTASTAFNALSPLTTAGDTLYGGTSGAGTRLAIGTAGQVLTVNAGATAPQWSTPTTGTVTAVSVASANGFAGTSSGGATPALTLSTSVTGVLKGNSTAISAATAGTDYSAGTSALTTGIVKSTTTTGALSIAIAADFPTLNQNTTGSAATLTTPRAIYGNNFDGSAALTQIIASTYGGTGNGFTKFTGATTAEKTYTLPDSSVTLLYAGGPLGTPSSGTLTNATGLPVGGISATGTPSASNYLRGDGTWSAVTATTATNLAGGALGSVPYQLLSGSTTFLSGNTTTTPQFLTSTGVLGVATAPTYTGSTGSGNVVLATSPTLVTPILGTPTSGTLTNCTGLPNAGLLNSSVTVTAGTGMSGGGAVALGSSVTLTNAGVTSIVAGTGISVSGATGAVTVTNTGPVFYNGSYVCVGGGGGGSGGGAGGSGGGGGGGFVYGDLQLTTGTVYTVTVGGGGNGNANAYGSNGTSSTITGSNIIGVTALGGGGGAWTNTSGAIVKGSTGGSGGGGSCWNANGYVAGGIGYGLQGFDGGVVFSNNSANRTASGGGGGGNPGAMSWNDSFIGGGGNGAISYITGSATYYAGGGAGVSSINGAGTAGDGGGGTGSTSGTGGAGTVNTGGGGGGGQVNGGASAGGAGGKGVIIISVLTSKYTATTTGSPTVTTNGNFTVMKFTSSGSYTA